MPTISSKQCSKCKGSGFLEYTPEVCKMCCGIKCMYCNNTGLDKMHYDLCYICFGDGTLDHRT